MKSTYLFLILLSSFLWSCDDDDYPYAEVPSVVLNKLQAEYPNSKDAEFNREGENYIVEFEIDDNDHKALINSSGKILQEKKEISWSELPRAVRETLQKNYGKKEIKDPELVRMSKEIYYQAEVRRFLFNQKVVLNEAGKEDADLNYWK